MFKENDTILNIIRNLKWKASMQDKDIIDLIRHIVYLREQIKLRDRIILKLTLEIKQLKGETNEL